MPQAKSESARSGEPDHDAHESEVALIVGGGPGVSASCARLFCNEGMHVAIAARTPDKPVLQQLEDDLGVRRYACDAGKPDHVTNLFRTIEKDLGRPKLVVHNIDGRSGKIFRQKITEADPKLVQDTVQNSLYSAFLVGQQAAMSMLAGPTDEQGHRGTILFTNASAAYKGFPLSGAFAMACFGKSGLAQSMARELMPQGIHVAHIPIDAAIGWTQEDGTRAHWFGGTTTDDNMADPDRIADVYLQLHRQHRSTWAYEIVLRPWMDTW